MEQWLWVAEPILCLIAWVGILDTNRQQGWRRRAGISALTAIVAVTAAIPIFLGAVRFGFANGFAGNLSVTCLSAALLGTVTSAFAIGIARVAMIVAGLIVSYFWLLAVALSHMTYTI